MSILTKENFITQAQTRSKTLTFSASINEARNEYRSSKTTSIFLSHSHLDRDMIEAGIVFFRGLNVTVYVDWADQTMPESTNGITANKIKSKIDANRKFILLATNNAVVSKWCNWELGIGDTKKLSQDNLAIIPLADNNGDWNGNEYLQIYPRIEAADSVKYKGQFKVVYPNNDIVWLDDWLKR